MSERGLDRSAAETSLKQAELDREVRRLSARRSRRSFLVMAAAALGGYGFYDWLRKSPSIGMLQTPLRRALEYNAALSRKLFQEGGLAPTYPVHKAVADLRFNGNFGLNLELKLSSWRLQLIGVDNALSFPQFTPDVAAWVYESENESAASSQTAPQQDDSKGPVKAPPAKAKQAAKSKKDVPAVMMPHELVGQAVQDDKGMVTLTEAQTVTVGASDSGTAKTPGLLLTMDDLRKFPHRELVTEFKCIEGWSEIVHWGGVRLADVIEAYPPAKTPEGREPRYVYMETADSMYYCGYDMAACRHPQSLLVYEMSGMPLNKYHGMPLRLHMPIKYGYKQIKQIAQIRYTDTRPDDFWEKLGYDWYAGL